MKKPSLRHALVFVALLGALAPRTADACSTLCLRHEGRIVFGKNYDWNVEDGLLMVNKRGVTRRSADEDAKNAARWTSTFGSVTFNQYGRDFPSGGMNEAGLVIELMWADGSRYPDPDARPSVGCLEWIQYQLDTARSVPDVIASDARVRIESRTPLHYLIADREGNVAAIEFIGGRMVAATGAGLPVAALTNDLYADSLRFMKEVSYLPRDAGSRARFVRAAHRVRSFSSPPAAAKTPLTEPVAYAFDTLADVAQPARTQWSIVYEIDRGLLHFRTLSNPAVRDLSLKALDFSCASPVLTFDLETGAAGDVAASLRPYTREDNLRLIRSSYAQTEFLAGTPASELSRMAALPEQGACGRTGTPGR